MKPETIDTVVFDLDGVLVLGSNQGYLDCHHYALSSVGLSLDRDFEKKTLMEYWSHPHEFQLRLFIGDNEELLAQACQKYEEYLFSPRFFDGITILPGSARLLEELGERGYKLGIATGMHRRQLEILFNEALLDGRAFAAMISGYDLPQSEHQKPHPFMLERVIEDLGSTSARSLYIGDSEDDIVMARRAGVKAIAVLSGNLDRDAAVRLQPDFVLADATELPGLLARGLRAANSDPSRPAG